MNKSIQILFSAFIFLSSSIGFSQTVDSNEWACLSDTDESSTELKDSIEDLLEDYRDLLEKDLIKENVFPIDLKIGKQSHSLFYQTDHGLCEWIFSSKKSPKSVTRIEVVSASDSEDSTELPRFALGPLLEKMTSESKDEENFISPDLLNKLDEKEGALSDLIHQIRVIHIYDVVFRYFFKGALDRDPIFGSILEKMKSRENPEPSEWSSTKDFTEALPMVIALRTLNDLSVFKELEMNDYLVVLENQGELSSSMKISFDGQYAYWDENRKQIDRNPKHPGPYGRFEALVKAFEKFQSWGSMSGSAGLKKK